MTRRHRAHAAVFLAAMALCLSACSLNSVGVEDGGPSYREPVDTRTEPPSQVELNEMLGEDIREIDASLDANPNLIHCEDVTSYDYNWKNDLRCTRPDGTVFYTDEAGALAQDGLDPNAACRNDGTRADARVAKMMRRLGFCD